MDLTQEIEKSKNRILETTKFIMDCGIDVDINIEERLGFGEELLKMKELHKRYTAALESAKSERTLDGFMTAFNTNWEEEQRRRLNIKNTKEYKDYKAELEKIAGTTTSISEDASDPDIVVTGGNFVNFNDPWTKAIMKNPVRNTICGHNYDKDSVIGLIKDNIGIICPVLGCASKTPIQPHHLTPNVELRIEIEKLQSLEEND